MKRAYKEGGMPLKQMVNAIEDLRIERETFKEFLGPRRISSRRCARRRARPSRAWANGAAT